MACAAVESRSIQEHEPAHPSGDLEADRRKLAAGDLGTESAPVPAHDRRRGTRPNLTASDIIALQRSAGNQAVTHLVQREDAPAPPNYLLQLDETLSSWTGSASTVVEILGKLTPADKATVLAKYRKKLTSFLSFEKMKDATDAAHLAAPLATRLDWLGESTVLGVRNIGYDEIRPIIQGAPQSERDALKSEKWKSFFNKVCNAKTVATAVTDLGFDLETQLTWMKDIVISVRAGINMDDTEPLLKAKPTELSKVSTDAWLPFWEQVCTNDTMARRLVPILFPEDLVKQLKWMAAEGTDASLVKERVNGASPAKRLELFSDAGATALIRGFGLPDQVAIVQLLGGTAVQQLTLLGDAFPVTLLTWPTPSQEWVDALKSLRKDPFDVFAVAGTNPAWLPFIKVRLVEILRAKPDIVYGADLVNAVWGAYGNGTTFVAADTLVVFHSLFGQDLGAPGADLIYPTGADKVTGNPTRKRHHVVAPTDAMARGLMTLVHPLGRNEVAAAKIWFSDQTFYETQGAAGAWVVTSQVNTGSVYTGDNKIIIGSLQTGAIGGLTEGPPGSTVQVPFATGMDFFTNNVRHEIGHAVGVKKIGEMAESGDEFATAYGDWKDSSEATFLASTWAPVAMPAGGWPTLNFGLGPVAATDAQVQSWLIGLLADGAEVRPASGAINTGTNPVPTKFATIQASIWGGEGLVRFIAAVIAGGATSAPSIQDSAYQFPNFPPPDPVLIYSTRGGRKFMSYSKGAYDKMHVSTGWYSLSSPREMFAEMYTKKYSAGGLPDANNSKDPAAFFTALEKERDPMFGAPPELAPAPAGP